MISFAFHLLISWEMSRWEGRFDEDVRQLVNEVKNKLDTNEAVLTGFSAFLQAVERSDTEAALKYAAGVASAYPHIYMIEVARKLPLTEQPAFEALMRKSWRADFKIKDFVALTRGQSSSEPSALHTWPILFLYPSLPNAQAIYGVRLETVEYVVQSMALAEKSPHPVATPVFKMYEGGSAYILLQEVTRASPADTGDINFFGSTMLAMLVIKTQSLFPVLDNNSERQKLNFSAVLEVPGGQKSLLFQQKVQDERRLDQTFLPSFKRHLTIDNASQPVSFDFERQVLWSDFLNRELLMLIVCLLVALMLLPWLTIRHYLALNRAEIEHERAAYLATHDVLTDLPNRFLFQDRFAQTFLHWQRNGGAFALLLIDLDHFKAVNDQYGHEVGDLVLITASQRMTRELRSFDTVARHGGDEFVVLLANVLNADDARKVGEKLLAVVAAPIITAAGTLVISCSVGVAICPEHGETLDTLRRHADQAMYRAKDQGRNAVSVFAFNAADES
jgi:diguanylate cyclase (GGDEF)-like protein